MRKKVEFYCTNCGKYFDIKLNTSLNGNYRVNCPNCDHIHYRQVKDGKITDTRFPENDSKILIEDIRPMKACCRDFQKEDVLDNLGVTAGADAEGTEPGFMRRLWKDRVFS